jgi:PAS domain S-box-containing protein
MAFLKHFHLNTRFNIILLIIFLLLAAINAVEDYNRQQKLIVQDATDSSRMLAKQIIETRAYLSSVLVGEANTNHNLIPQIAATNIAKRITKGSKYTLRQISLRYRNPDNIPDSYETTQLKAFNAGNVRESHKVVIINGEKVYRYILPMVAEESCLECHGEYKNAPDFIKERFPPGHHSYGYRVGEVIGAVSASISMADLYKTIGKNVKLDLLYSAATLLFILFIMGSIIRRQIITPITTLSEDIANVTRTGNFGEQLKVVSDDEIGRLVIAYNNMATELQQRILQRQESDERYRNVIEMAQAAIITFLPDGKIVIVNHVAELLLGLPKTDLIGMSFYDFLPDPAPLRQATAKLAEEGETGTGVRTFQLLKNIRGQQQEVEFVLSATTSDGRHMFTVIIHEPASEE